MDIEEMRQEVIEYIENTTDASFMKMLQAITELHYGSQQAILKEEMKQVEELDIEMREHKQYLEDEFRIDDRESRD